MPDELISRYARPVPRYTSYPTAPHFHQGIDNRTYRSWLEAVPPVAPLSFYVHVPFCDRLCWFCACHTKQVLRYEPIAAYLAMLQREIETVAGILDGRGHVGAIHLGGGSPSMLRHDDILALAATFRSRFKISDQLEFSVEIDPNDMTVDRYDAFAAAGISRVSIGVQDFNPQVQQAINRIQTMEQTKAVVDGMRLRGVTSVNLDVLYGLPHQTVESVEATIEQVLAMRPDRIALFGYAHVPWMKTHQRMIDGAVLPDAAERLQQSQAAAARIVAGGYSAIGIDHFARPSDTLATASAAGRLRRNFQGYTTDESPSLIGFGASAIGGLPQGYVQNQVATGEYMGQVREHGLAVARGIALTDEDRMRRWVIERLMCDFAVSTAELTAQFGEASHIILEEMGHAATFDADGVVDFDGRRFSVTERGRPFVRSIAAAFDTYLESGAGRHSIAV